MNGVSGEAQARNIETIRDFYAAFCDGDFTRMNAILSPELILYEAKGLPYGGTYRGHEGFRDVMSKLLDHFDGVRPVDLKIAAVDDLVMAYMTLMGTARSTGRKLEMPLCEVWTFRDGQILEGRLLYFDTHAVRQICGV